MEIYEYPFIDEESMKLSLSGLINNTKNILRKYKNEYPNYGMDSKEVYIFTRQLVVLCDSFNWRHSYNIEECYNSYYIYRNLSTIIELNDDSYIELLISRFYINDHFMGLNIRIQLYSWDSIKHLYLYNKDVYTHGFGFAEGGNPMEDLLIEKLNNLFNNAPYVHVD